MGVIGFYNGFVRHLGSRAVKHRVIPLQLVGRLEDYLVKEFVSYVFRVSGGSRFAEVNCGRRDQQKVDIGLLRRGRADLDVLEGLIEAKYLRNRHRRWPNWNGAMDEILSTLRSLSQQLRLRPDELHGFHEVRLTGRTTRVYGLVLVGFTRRSDECDHKQRYFDTVLARAAQCGLRFHDYRRPYLRSAYEDEPITVLGEEWVTSLRVGLWRA